jgi:protein-S-isoprenylcysteine O-methyltransferase Ste14
MKPTLIQKIRVPLGFAYAVLFLWFSRPTPALLVAGVGLAGAGLAVRVWASGYLNKGRELATCGPYAWTRNPLYLGSFLMGLGFAVSGARLFLVLFFSLLFFAVYWPVMRREEQELAHWFGGPYQSYRDGVPLFLPSFRRLYPSSRPEELGAPSNFEWARVIFNREYRAVAGFVLVSVFLWVKMIWF